MPYPISICTKDEMESEKIKAVLKKRNKTKLVFGIGVNDADYSVTSVDNGIQVMCIFYRTWRSMLGRCYCEKYQSRQPSYIGCSVTPEWHLFSVFRVWMQSQSWKGCFLDKDLLLAGNRIYSPNACLFVSRKVNMVILGTAESCGNFPVGVSWDPHKKRFIAECSVNGKGKKLGAFRSASDAHDAWRKFKASVLKNVAFEQTDKRVAFALLQRAEKLLLPLHIAPPHTAPDAVFLRPKGTL